MVHNQKIESTAAMVSLVAAIALAFTSLVILDDHDIASGVLLMCAQLLTLTATIFGLDYKIKKIIEEYRGNAKS